jgi:fucose permease
MNSSGRHSENLWGFRLLLYLSFIAFISLGLSDGLLGVAWPSVAGQFEKPLSRLALLQLGATCGFFISSTNAGTLIRRLGVGRLLILSNVLVLIALSGFSFARSWPLIIASMFILGTGGGAVDAGLNAYSAERFTKEQVTMLHAFYGLGAMIGPVVMRRVLLAGSPWQHGYLAVLAIIAALLLLFIATRKRWAGRAHLSHHHQPEDAQDRRDAALLLSPLKPVARGTIFAGIALFLVYTGLEVTAGAWSFTWLSRGRGIPAESAALWVGIYWGALMAGRIFFGFFGGRWHLRSILWLMILSVIAGCILFLQPWSDNAAMAALPLIGFACAPLFPLFVSYTPTVARRPSAPDLIGRQISAASIGSAAVPLLVGGGVELFSLKAIPLSLLILSLLLALFYRLWVRKVPR